MRILNSNRIFNFVNNGFVYLCEVDDGSFWVRSTSGRWVQVKTSKPMSTEVIDADFQTFLKAGLTVTENDVKVDNASQIVVDPVIEQPVNELKP